MYANDCIAIRERDKRRGLKRIDHHSDAELDAAIERARRRFGDDYWIMLHGIDAYMERRKRRAKSRADRVLDLVLSGDDIEHMWGINGLE